jgi:hypothetical protein
MKKALRDTAAMLTCAGLTLATMAGLEYILPTKADEAKALTPYEPTDNPAQRVQEFIRGERAHLDEMDLYAPSVSEALRTAALDNH